MEAASVELPQTVQDGISGQQLSDASANFAQSFQALFSSSDATSQLQLLQAMGAMSQPSSVAQQMVFIPTSSGGGAVFAGAWPQQYVMLPRMNQYVMATSDASGNQGNSVMLTSMSGSSPSMQGLTGIDGLGSAATSSPHRSLSSPAQMLNGVGANVLSSSATHAMSQSQASTSQTLSQQSNLPKPPVKPLSAYMTFSKSIWPQVKSSHNNASVCEIGAIIGHMWNDLDEAEKKRYNDNYAADKVRYSQELQVYLQATGLKASDLAKPRSRKGRTPAKPASGQKSTSQSGDDAAAAALNSSLPPFSQVWAGSPANPATAPSTGQNVLMDGGQMASALYSHANQESKSSDPANGSWPVGAAAGTQPTTGAEAELQSLRDAVSNITQEAEQLKRQLDDAVAYIRQLEEQQTSVLGELAMNGTYVTPSVGTM